MRRKQFVVRSFTLVAVVLVSGLAPNRSWACACGCGVFEVGTASLFPSGSGGTLFFGYNFSDQYSNWHDASKAPAADNMDKVIRTHFFTLGAQYMFNRSWGVMAQLPYSDRYFKTTDEDGHIAAFTHDALGDVRIEGMYTGWSEDMSTGVRFGVKLASGDFTYSNFDRDTQIGTGSTDLLLGAYHIGTLPLTFHGRSFDWFAQANWQVPMWTQQQYRPGKESNGALGIFYNFGAIAFAEEVAPVLNLIGSDRQRDRGANANPDDTGYDRLLIGPGGEMKLGIVKVYADAEFPIYQHVNGNQLTAPVLLKLIVSYEF